MEQSIHNSFLISPAVPEDIDEAAKPAKRRASYEIVKRLCDILMSAGAIVFASPVFVLVALCLLLSQGRPLFIAHKRIGRSGRPFSCYKFRTMVVDSDRALEEHLQRHPEAREEWAASRKLRDDPRVTPIGHALRLSSIDELPQLFNVLRGDMSLVGPRPIVEAELSYYGIHIQKYYQVRPGLTGLWQVSGRSDLSYTTRVNLDTSYIDARGFARDVWIILQTVPAILRSRGAI